MGKHAEKKTGDSASERNVSELAATKGILRIEPRAAGWKGEAIGGEGGRGEDRLRF